MSRPGLLDSARGSLVGLAVGDALGRPAEGEHPAKIKKIWGRITGFLNDEPAGSDDTEYAIFSARLLIRHGKGLTPQDAARAWRSDIASQTGGFKGAGFSELGTIQNLRKGLEPPASGVHVHSWSDGLAMRAAPFGVAAAGDPALAAHLVEQDGSVSHSGEGIYSGRAVAAAVAAAMVAGSVDEVIEAALGVVPEDSWTARAIRRAVEIGRRSESVWDALEPLYDATACAYYFWSDLGPEAVGLAFGVIAAARGDFRESVLGGVNIGRDTDTIAAIAGGIAGALNGFEAIPREWSDRIRSVKGTCIHTVAGADIRQVAEDLLRAAAGWNPLIRERIGEPAGERAGEPADGRIGAPAGEGYGDRSDPAIGGRPESPPAGTSRPQASRAQASQPGASQAQTSQSGASHLEFSSVSPLTSAQANPAETKNRIRGALLGAAVGDAMSWPAMFHRGWVLPSWTRRLRREIDAHAETSRAIRPPMPFSLNRPPETFALGPTDDTEWMAWTIELLLEGGGAYDMEAAVRRWSDLAHGEVRGGVSTQAALHNLKSGLLPPASGRDNPHYFDDGACIRAIAIGAAWAGDPEGAAQAAGLDASITNSLDGVWGAQAVAAGVAAACAGATPEEAVSEACARLPEGSWIARTVRHALGLARGAESGFAAMPVLLDEIVNREYTYGTAAPETVALAVALATLFHGDPAAGLMAAATAPKSADSLPSLVGAFLGALRGPAWIPQAWAGRVRELRGICLPHLAGRDFRDLVERLASPGGRS